MHELTPVEKSSPILRSQSERLQRDGGNNQRQAAAIKQPKTIGQKRGGTKKRESRRKLKDRLLSRAYIIANKKNLITDRNFNRTRG